MLGDISKPEHIYFACRYTDLWKSIDGLAALVKQRLKLNPYSNSRGRRLCGAGDIVMRCLR